MKRLGFGLAALVAGCALAPPYAPPEVAVPAAYKTAFDPSGDARWKPAAPGDAVPRGAWWTDFGDAELNRLVDAATAANQELALADANLRASRAATRVARAARRPQVTASFGAARGQPSQVAPGLPDGVDIPAYEVYRAGLAASYEVDLFGRLRDAEVAAAADAAAEAALYQSILLTVQADVAQNYFLLRQSEAELAVERASLKTREEAVALLERQVAAGDISDLDLARTRSELENARAAAIALERAAAQYANATALLCGTTPAALAIADGVLPAALPNVPAGLPSTLLERRPDIAEAERRMQAANARIGIARAAFYPVLNLTASFGTESSELGQIFQWGSRTWALGPLSGALLAGPLFDGGRNRANLERAFASLDGEIANYRQTVLGAFREVEDGLVGLQTLARQSDAIAAALVAAERAYAVALARYDAGQTAYLDVLDARRTLVAVRRADASLRGERALTTVALIRALGGGWAAE